MIIWLLHVAYERGTSVHYLIHACMHTRLRTCVGECVAIHVVQRAVAASSCSEQLQRAEAANA